MKKVLPVLILFGCVVLMSATIDLQNLFPYAAQTTPNYITKDNTPNANNLSDAGATLGRVLFYDKSLSVNGSVSCGSCHKQQFAFGDTAALSAGFNGGATGRHSMRLVNSRFGTEEKFFWNERAASLEEQTTGPIQDHVEMGFSGLNGNPDLDSLIRRLETKPYYQQLFTFVYSSPEITEEKIQKALAQFVRSIQSFDSKFDIGRAQVANLNQNFPNFTVEENTGKTLFLNPPANGGAGCQGCHRAPEFDIDPATLNNGIIGVAGNPGQTDLTNTRAPSLRDLVNPAGQLNGPLMHNGVFTNLLQVINHYNQIPNNPANTNLDQRLRRPGNQTQNLQLTQAEKNALVAFLQTLTGSQIYTAEQWSDPFDSQGNLDLIPVLNVPVAQNSVQFELYPNPFVSDLTIRTETGNYQAILRDIKGNKVFTQPVSGSQTLQLKAIPSGTYLLTVLNKQNNQATTQRIVKQ